MSNKSFISDCINGCATIKDLNKYIEYWHANNTGNSLQNFLGLSDDEYTAWGKSNDNYLAKLIQLKSTEYRKTVPQQSKGGIS